MGEVVYSPPGFTGGIGLKGVRGYGVYVDDAGKASLPNGVTSGGPVQLPTYTVSSLPPAGTGGNRRARSLLLRLPQAGRSGGRRNRHDGV